MKKILFVLAAVMFCAASTSAQCVYDHTTGVIKIYKHDGSLKGEFSVSATKKVKFAQGNLQYTRESTEVAWSTGKFSFMENQWDYIETTANPYCTENYGDKTAIGLFGWGTSGWDNTTADATSVHYQPYSTCNTDHSTDNNNYQYGPSLANVAASESWSKEVAGKHPYEKYDWGVFNSRDLGAGWRTLTNDEWGYLFGRTGAKASTVNGNSDCTYTKATINTDGTAVTGIILFPDGGTFAASEFTEVGSPNTGNVNYTTTCTIAQWTALEGKGCVFLPAAGYRVGTRVTFVGSEGNYWSSSANNATRAYRLSISSSSVNPQYFYPRSTGYSVRLVKDVVVTP